MPRRPSRPASPKAPSAPPNGSPAKKLLRFQGCLARTVNERRKNSAVLPSCNFLSFVVKGLLFALKLRPVFPSPHSRYPIPHPWCGTALVTPFRQDGPLTTPRAIWSRGRRVRHRFSCTCGTTGDTHAHPRRMAYVIDTQSKSPPDASPSSPEPRPTPRTGSRESQRTALRPGVNAILTASPYYNAHTGRPVPPLQSDGKPSATSPSSSTMRPVAPRPTSSPQPWRASPKSHIVGVEASGNMTQIAEAINAVPETFQSSATTRSRSQSSPSASVSSPSPPTKSPMK